MQIASSILGLVLAVTPTGAPVSDDPTDVPPPDPRSSLAHFGFERDDRGRVRAGELVSVNLEATRDNELAGAAAILIDAPLSRVTASLVDGRLLDANPRVIAAGAAATITEAGYDAADVEEIVELIFVEPGEDFNLSSDELARLSAVARPFRARALRRSDAAMTQVNRGYLAVLRGRLEAYDTDGIEGLSDYTREEGETSSPRAELASALDADRPLLERMPALRRVLDGADDAAVEQRMRWIKADVDDRPTFILTHDLCERSGGHVALFERQYFVGQSYNSAQWICLALQTSEGTLVISARRVFSDRVTGIGSSATRRLGRRLLKSDLVEQLEQVRDAVLATGVQPAS